MSGNIIAAIITSATTVACLVYTTRRQARRIDKDNRAALDTQTDTVKAHVNRALAAQPPQDGGPPQ